MKNCVPPVDAKRSAQAGASGRAMGRLAKAFVLLVSLIGLGTWGGNAVAVTKTSVAAGGNWNTAATWSPSGVPAAGDTVIIAGPGTVTINTNVVQTTGSVTVNSGATLAATANNTYTFGALTINSGGTYTTSRVLTVLGATNITGTINLSGGRANIFTGDVTLNSGAVWNNTTTSTQTFSGNFTNNATTFTTSTGGYTFDGAAKTLSGATVTAIPTVTFTGNYTNSGTLTASTLLTVTGAAIRLTNNGTITATTALSGTGGVTQGTTGVLNIGATSAITTLTATAAGNTVNYTGAGQTVKATTYHHLGLSGSGAKAMGATTINGNFTMSGAATTAPTGALSVGGNFTIGTGTTFTAGNFNHTVSGNFDATGTFTNTGSTVTLNGATAQIISGTNPVAFNILAVSAVSPNITLATHVTATTLTGTVTLTPSCPDYTLTSTTPAQVLHSCPPVTLPANFDCVERGVTYTPNPVSPTRNPLYTKLAGTAFSFDVVALKADGTVETTYASASNKNVTVELVDGTGATACAIRTVLTPPVSQTLTFTAADLGRKTAASMTVSKAYANLRCRVTDANQVPSVVGCSVDNFSVRPVSLALTATGLGADATGVSTIATPVVKAGANFTLTATASDTGYTGTPTIDPTALAAHSGAVRTGTLTGTFTAAASGVVSSTFTYDEVGYFKLNANGLLDTTFTAVDNSVGDCTADFSTMPDVNGKYGCKVGSAAAGYFGRFIPDHFTLTTGSFIDRTDINTGVSETCSSSFTYMGEDFKTTFTLVAKNSTPAATQNYTGGHAKFDLTTWSNFAFTGSGGTLVQGSAAPSGAWGSTAGTYGTADITATHTVTRVAAPAAPYTSFSVSAQPSYMDGTATIALAASTVVHAGTSEQRYGRLKLSNAHGSELLNLPVPIQTQYWNGTAFVINAADNCTTLAASNIKLTSPPAGVNATVGGAFSSGAGSLTLTKPSPAAKGVVALCVDLDSSGTGDITCVASAPFAAIPYLHTGTAYDKDPTAQATFGVYKGSNEFIYLREMY